ncbi:MAG: T9SS type A sorting domain-containing protein [Bacteroidales bacterium]|nr:T9SS type A sorting domain-containing protein [Bacteroidales bacterium]
MRNFKVLLLVVLLVCFKNNLQAQETIKVMHYNLLYYGKKTDFCTTTNNNIDKKNGYLKTIIQYVQPDIFSVNELDGDASYPVSDDAKYLLDNALNVDGVDYYRKTESPSVYLANIIFYNSNKLILKESNPISFMVSGNLKAFNAFKFYFNSDDLQTTNDTAFLYCVVAHLKAGNDDYDLTQKVYESSLIMDYFEGIGEKGNYMIMGDFNVYTPTEECFQSFINPDNSNYTFNDPANQIGEWSKNYDYRYYHTQSTHQDGDCFSGGGMDDRFDFILASDNIMDGIDHYTYINNSYKIIGQDGSRYNGSLNTSSNTAVPNVIAQALYNMSDHLPVYMEMQVDQNLGAPLSIEDLQKEQLEINYENPVTEYLKLESHNIRNTQVEVDLVSINGTKVLNKTYRIYNDFNVSIPLNGIPSGIYILKVTSNEGLTYSSKVIVKK